MERARESRKGEEVKDVEAEEKGEHGRAFESMGEHGRMEVNEELISHDICHAAVVNLKSGLNQSNMTNMSCCTLFKMSLVAAGCTMQVLLTVS